MPEEGGCLVQEGWGECRDRMWGRRCFDGRREGGCGDGIGVGRKGKGREGKTGMSMADEWRESMYYPCPGGTPALDIGIVQPSFRPVRT